MPETSSISDWHAHVYFQPDEVERARVVCETVRDRFAVPMGRMHVKPVGPHPTGSCQMTVPPEKFGEVFAWLALNRDGLTVFGHANTDDALTDHTAHVVWLGKSRELDIDILREALARSAT